MVVGLEAVFPDGHIARIKDVPRRAAGLLIFGRLSLVTKAPFALLPKSP